MDFLPFDEILCCGRNGVEEPVFAYAERHPRPSDGGALQGHFGELRFYDTRGGSLTFDAAASEFRRHSEELRPTSIIRNGERLPVVSGIRKRPHQAWQHV